MAGLRILGYLLTMNSEPLFAKRSAAADIVGLPAERLSDALDGILPGEGAPPAPAAPAPTDPELLQCDYEPIRLEDLLCGLPPLPDDDELTGRGAPLEPSLLLAEIAQPLSTADGGWPAPPPALPVPAEAEPPAVSPILSLREAEPGTVMDASAAETTPPEMEEEDEAPVLVLTDNFLAAEAPPPEPEPEPASAAMDDGEAARLSAMIDALLTAYGPMDAADTAKGDASLPERRDALAILLSDPPPTQDFAALDALYACWPKTTENSPSRALLAVAYNLSRNFGLPGKLPMASSRAWRMLSPAVFEAELAQRLIDVGSFIADWQRTQRTFLILEFGEVELIEHLFESLPPATHAVLLAGVMNFKVLSNRRMGLLRRVPNRLKRQVTPLLPDRKDEALVVMAHTKALLERVADPSGFAPIVDTAGKMLEELEKMMRTVAAMGAPPPTVPPGGGRQLGRMG